MADASTITLPASIDSTTFSNLVTISGGEVENAGTLARQYVQDNGGLAALQSYATSITNIRNIALAMQNYNDVKRSMPVISNASYFDANGIPYLSWRVHILPYLDATPLYNKFHLDEPWDSPNNLPLLAEMPDVFRSIGDPANSITTRMETFTGPNAPFGFRAVGQRQSGPTLASITDGTSNTIAFAEVGADKAVLWTKPDDSPFDIHNPLAALGNLTTGAFRAAFFDAHTVTFSSDINPAIFSALVTRIGLERVDSSTIGTRELARNGIPRTGTIMVNNFKYVTLAMQNHHDTRKIFPVPKGTSLFDANGLPYLSWRVYLLPFLESSALYNKFHLNEPWDSPNNLPLLDEMPDVFRTVGDPWDSVTTRVVEFTGPGASFLNKPSGNQTGPTIAQIADGTSRTIQLVEAGSGAVVPWTKPTDVAFYPNNPFSTLGDVGSSFIAAFFDAHVETQLSSESISLLKAYITYAGGEDIANPPAIMNVPGFYISQTAGNTVANEFGADVFDVVLDKAPVTSVVMSLNASDMNAAALDKAILTFTPANWNVSQRVTFRPIDNHVINPDQAVNITVSVLAALSDDAYDPVASQSFTATIRNDDFAPADYDHNGLVEQSDYTTWRSNYGGTANNTLAADGNGNGTVDAGDYVFWRKKMSTSGAGAAVGVGASTFAALESSAIEETPALEGGLAADAAFADLAVDTWALASTTLESAKPSTTLSIARSHVGGAQTDLLLILRGQAISVRPDEAEVAPSNEPLEQLSDTDFATALIADWPTLE
jgi:hypothetical protein